LARGGEEGPGLGEEKKKTIIRRVFPREREWEKGKVMRGNHELIFEKKRRGEEG